MGREARVQRNSPKSGVKKRRDVRIWTAQDIRTVLTAMGEAIKPPTEETLTIQTGDDPIGA